MVRLHRREFERGPDVFRLQVGKISKDFLLRHLGGEQVEDVLDADAHPADTRTPAALVGVDRNAIEVAHTEIIPAPEGLSNCVAAAGRGPAVRPRGRAHPAPPQPRPPDRRPPDRDSGHREISRSEVFQLQRAVLCVSSSVPLPASPPSGFQIEAS
jgi:hypothetical protein